MLPCLHLSGPSCWLAQTAKLDHYCMELYCFRRDDIWCAACPMVPWICACANVAASRRMLGKVSGKGSCSTFFTHITEASLLRREPWWLQKLTPAQPAQLILLVVPCSDS